MSLTKLPTEIHIIIFDMLREDVSLSPSQYEKIKSDTTLLCLSSTCSLLRSSLRPYIFETIELRNTEGSGSKASRIASGRFGQNVKHLYYVGSAPGDIEEGFGDVEDILPQDVWDVLVDLNCFPNLRSVTIKFDFDFRDGNKWRDGFEMFDRLESDEDVFREEDAEGWRALMASTWDALSRNQTPNFDTLEICQLVPKKVSTFSAKWLPQLLRKMKHFSLSTLGMEDRLHTRTANTLRSMESFYSRLDRWFFDHLRNVKTFTLTAHEHCHLRFGGTENHLPLQLHDYHMPNLVSVYIEHVFMCDALLEFLGRSIRTLQELILKDCMGSEDRYNDVQGTRWKNLFQHLMTSRPERLRRMVIELEKASSEDHHTSDMLGGPEDAEHEIGMDEREGYEHIQTLSVRNTRNHIFSRPLGRRMFAYKVSNDGYLYNDVEQTWMALTQAEDYDTYTDLMRLIERNKERRWSRLGEEYPG